MVAQIYKLYRVLAVTMACLLLPLGLGIAILLPPFQVPDETLHWTSAYLRAERVFSAFRPAPEKEKCSIANSLEGHFEVGRLAFDPQQKMQPGRYASLGAVGSWCQELELGYGSFLTYPGVTLARPLIKGENLHAPRALAVFYMARIIHGLLLVLFLGRILYFMFLSGEPLIPGLMTSLAIMCSPLFMQQSFGINADLVCFLFSVMLIHLCIYVRSFRLLDWSLLTFATWATATTKPQLLLLLPFCLLLSYVRAYRRSDRHDIQTPPQQFIWNSGLLLLSSTVLAIWILTQNHEPPDYQKFGRDISGARQLQYIIAHPAATWDMLVGTVAPYFSIPAYADTLGWLSATMSRRTLRDWYHLLWFGLIVDLLLLGAGLYQGSRLHSWRALKNWEPLCAILVLGAGYLFMLSIALSLYILWSPVGQAGVDGLQARYFFPVFLIAPVAIGSTLSNSSFQLRAGGFWNSSHNSWWATTAGALVITYMAITWLSLVTEVILDLKIRYW